MTAVGAGLLGSDRPAGRYAALLLEGVRLVETGQSPDVIEDSALADALSVLATTCGVPPKSDWLGAAVRAGVAEDARIPPPPTSSTAVAAVTTWVLPAAACALVATTSVDTDAATAMDEGLRDIAAALMVVHVPAGGAPPDEPPGEGLLLGHALAAGWLATQLWAAGVVGVPQSFERTVAAVVGTP